ncbi:hypothetical protein I1A62_01850 (plasmid) [Rhodococcus sp. USK10]|uniref:hypothetical protein n=1 Tax=Rhodococcus sp. USK10 TaxID=2789739 RepID=UPI001C5F2C28|nr:hypothetical protein [Rhodococcus sp. USK10]QYA99917.1 hypothetical protein I1A62_01850 [Rhodococcus sp. USK10]
MQRCGDAAMMWGGLSVVLFWAFGLGVVLGAVAVVAGVTALWGRPPGGADPTARDALAGIAAGAVGIALGLLFLWALISPTPPATLP